MIGHNFISKTIKNIFFDIPAYPVVDEVLLILLLIGVCALFVSYARLFLISDEQEKRIEYLTNELNSRTKLTDEEFKLIEKYREEQRQELQKEREEELKRQKAESKRLEEERLRKEAERRKELEKRNKEAYMRQRVVARMLIAEYANDPIEMYNRLKYSCPLVSGEEIREFCRRQAESHLKPYEELLKEEDSRYQ